MKSLAPGSYSFEYHLGKKFFNDMESDDIRDADVDVALSVDHRADMYVMRFNVTGNITIPCDRCLDDMVLPVDTVYNITVRYGDTYDDSDDNVLIIPFSDQNLNVAYIIYDTVALSIPIKHVHPKGQCNKAMSDILRRHSATDAPDDDNDDSASAETTTTDPRWDELKKLTDNN